MKQKWSTPTIETVNAEQSRKIIMAAACSNHVNACGVKYHINSIDPLPGETI